MHGACACCRCRLRLFFFSLSLLFHHSVALCVLFLVQVCGAMCVCTRSTARGYLLLRYEIKMALVRLFHRATAEPNTFCVNWLNWMVFFSSCSRCRLSFHFGYGHREREWRRRQAQDSECVYQSWKIVYVFGFYFKLIRKQSYTKGTHTFNSNAKQNDSTLEMIPKFTIWHNVKRTNGKMAKKFEITNQTGLVRIHFLPFYQPLLA